MSNVSTQTVIVKSEKNPILGAILGFCFGPLGLLYTHWKPAAIMLPAFLLSAVLIPLFVGIPMFFACMVGSAVWGYMACDKHNKQLHVPHQAQPVKMAA